MTGNYGGFFCFWDWLMGTVMLDIIRHMLVPASFIISDSQPFPFPSPQKMRKKANESDLTLCVSFHFLSCSVALCWFGSVNLNLFLVFVAVFLVDQCYPICSMIGYCVQATQFEENQFIIFFFYNF